MKLTEPYAQAAIPELMKREGMTHAEAEKFVYNNEFDQIEPKACISPYMIQTAYAIGERFGLDHDDCNEYAQEVCGRSLTKRHTNKIKRAVAKMNKDELRLNSKDIVVDAMSRSHNLWLNSKASRFFTTKLESGEQFQYLPLELAGWNEAKTSLQFAGPIAESIGLKVDEKEIKQECNKRTLELLERCDKNHPVYGKHVGERYIHKISYDNLRDMIVDGCNGHSEWWTSDIQRAMSDPSVIENVILPQLETKGFGADQELMKIIEARGMDIGELGPTDHAIDLSDVTELAELDGADNHGFGVNIGDEEWEIER